jgi:hypothetical protein
LIAVNAHVEEQCFFTNELSNLYHTAELLGCQYGEFNPKCVAATLIGGSQTFGATSPCRGFIHYDSVFYIAQAVGFTGEMAYWIASFAQCVDFIQFVPPDSCGAPLDKKFWTPPMRGFLRTSTLTGQHIRHLGLIYRGVNPAVNNGGISGLTPDLNDITKEGMLISAKKWAFNDTDMYCTIGLTEPTNGNYFDGNKCLTSIPFLDNTSPTAIVGPIPTPAINTTLGDQVMHYDCIGDTDCENPPYQLTNVKYHYEMETYFQQQTEYARLKNGQPVPTIIARLGIYMHQLADRASHFFCTDQADTAILGPRATDNSFYLSWNTTACNFPFHGTEHYWEQGVKPILAPQSWSALSHYFDELSAFATKFKTIKPEWFLATAKLLTKAEVVGTMAAPGTLPTLAMIPDVVTRVVKFMDELKKNGFEQVPGQDKPCPKWPGFSEPVTTVPATTIYVICAAIHTFAPFYMCILILLCFFH